MLVHVGVQKLYLASAATGRYVCVPVNHCSLIFTINTISTVLICNLIVGIIIVITSVVQLSFSYVYTDIMKIMFVTTVLL